MQQRNQRAQVNESRPSRDRNKRCQTEPALLCHVSLSATSTTLESSTFLPSSSFCFSFSILFLKKSLCRSLSSSSSQEKRRRRRRRGKDQDEKRTAMGRHSSSSSSSSTDSNYHPNNSLSSPSDSLSNLNTDFTTDLSLALSISASHQPHASNSRYMHVASTTRSQFLHFYTSSFNFTFFHIFKHTHFTSLSRLSSLHHRLER